MIRQFSKLKLGMLAALLVAATLPVMAEDSSKGGGNCPTAAGLNGLRPALDTRLPASLAGITGPGLAEFPAFLAVPNYGEFPLEPQAEVKTGQRTASSAASDVGGEDPGTGHKPSANPGRLARLLHHITWSWAPTSDYGAPFPISAMPNRP